MTLTFPTGTIKTFRPGTTTPYGIAWSRIGRYAQFIDAASAEFGPPATRIAATIAIESDGNPEAFQRNSTNGNSYGLMQVVPFGVGWNGWSRRVRELTGVTSDVDIISVLYDPETNIRVGSSILHDFYRQHGSWGKASSAFFLGNPDWRGADTVNGNTGAHYQATLNALMDEMQGGNVPEWKPVIYDIRTNADAGRFGLTPQERDKLLKNRIANRDGKAINAIGLHVQWGYTTGSLDWWVNGPNVQASATVMVQQDGSVLKVIPEEHGPWTQGDVKNPDARARKLFDRFGWNPNVYSLTIEAEDGQTEKINAAQEQTIAWLIRDWQKRYPQLAGADWEDRILGHYEINSVDRSRCGRYRDAMVASLRGGTTPTPEPTPQYAERVDIPQPSSMTAFPGTWMVEVIADSVPIKQYAAPDAAEVAPPLEKGRVFSAVYLTFGADGEPWWVSTTKGRVPVKGTRSRTLGIGLGESVMTDGARAMIREFAKEAADIAGGLEALAKEGEA